MTINSNLARREGYIKTSKNYSHIGRVKTKKIAAIKPVAYIFLIILAAITLSTYIMSLVKSSELSIKINSLKNQYNIQQSENIRLKTKLESMFTDTAKIEAYARQNLNMKKQSNNQINYIMSSNPEKFKKPTPKDAKTNNIFSNIKNWLENVF